MTHIKKAKLFLTVILILAALGGVLSMSGCGMDEEHAEAYEEVSRLAVKEYGGEDWVPTGVCRSWGMETPNYYDKYYFYIDKDLYNNYKDYWLEDVPEEDFYESYNESLLNTGDYVQHCINIYLISCEEDEDYRGVQLKKNTEYYLTTVYENALYYQYISRFQDKDNFFSNANFRVDENSVKAEILYHKEGKRWIGEEIAPRN